MNTLKLKQLLIWNGSSFFLFLFSKDRDKTVKSLFSFQILHPMVLGQGWVKLYLWEIRF